MTTPLPNPSSLLSGLLTLDRTLADFDANRAAQPFSASSSDNRVQVVVNGLLIVQSISIDPADLVLAPAALADKVKAVVNSALAAADVATAAAIKTLASSLTLPGLPAFGSLIPDYPDFNITANTITAQILANNPCQATDLFECRVGPVRAVVDAHRRVVTLVFDSPLPSSELYLAARVKEAINCAQEPATDRPEIDPVPPIVGSLGLQDLVIYAKGELRLNDRVHVRGLSCSGFGAIGNAGLVETNIGSKADVGNVLSHAKVVVRDGGRVHGFIRTSATFENHPDTEIGPVEEHAGVILPDLSLNVPFPGVTLGTIELEPNQQQTAGPGYYNKLHPKQNAQVFLSKGTYYFNELFLEPGSKVWLDQTSGPIVIWVRNVFTFRGAFQANGGAFPRVFVGYLGTDVAVVESKFQGTLSAPNAKISVSTIQSHEGAFHGKNVEVQPDTEICHRPFELRYDELPGTVPPGGLPPPTVDLGFETVAGWSASSQALLTSTQNPVTQGTRSLQLSNVTGATDVISANFSADLAPQGATRLIVDLWVPAGQPNPTFFGNFSVIISVPSAGVNAVNLGTLGLTGRPTNQFSQLEFALPAPVRAALDGNASDVSLKLVFSINAGSGPWYVDNIRFLLPPAALSSLDPILSFETAAKWSSPQGALTTSTQFKTHLTQSLRITSAPGQMQLVSVPFATGPLNAPLGKLRIDLRKPLPQPNSWHGQLQLQIDVPSAGISNATTAAVELTPLAGNTFSTIEFALPSNVVPIVNGEYADLKLKFTLNVPATSGPWHLDNIRFV